MEEHLIMKISAGDNKEHCDTYLYIGRERYTSYSGTAAQVYICEATVSIARLDQKSEPIFFHIGVIDHSQTIINE